METIKKPLWKIVSRKDRKGNFREYAEITLRCHPDEHKNARAIIESYGSIQRATLEILNAVKSISDAGFTRVIEELQRQHDNQIDEFKRHLKEHFGTLVNSGSVTIAPEHNPESILDSVWESIDK